MIRGMSSATGFDIYEPAKVLWFVYMEEIVFNRDAIKLNPLFDFKPMKRLEYWGDGIGRLEGVEQRISG